MSAGIAWHSANNFSAATSCSSSFNRPLDNYAVIRCNLAGLQTTSTGATTHVYVYFVPTATEYFKEMSLRFVALPSGYPFDHTATTFKAPSFLNHTYKLDGLGMLRALMFSLQNWGSLCVPTLRTQSVIELFEPDVPVMMHPPRKRPILCVCFLVT